MPSPKLLRRRVGATLCASAAFGALALSPAVAQASVTDTYGCTGSVQTSTAPAGAIAAIVTLDGAAGADSAYAVFQEGYRNTPNGGLGGAGDSLSFSLPASAGEVFDVNVGCTNGYNGGGASGLDEYYGEYMDPQGGGGSGGGATDITPDGDGFSSAYAVAAGGGGGGDTGSSRGGGGNGGDGGNGANTNAGAGNSEGTSGGGSGGIGGTNGGAGGAGGQSSSYTGANGGAGAAYQTASPGQGGNGGSGNDWAGGAGGGGGGWTGGGGGGSGSENTDGSGATGGGGGGGSSYLASGVTEIGSASPTSTGNGSVSITYEFPASIATNQSSEDFGTVAVGSSGEETVQVTNTGSTPLDIYQASLTGTNADEFSIANRGDTCSNQTVDAGDTCDITVELTPTTAGAKAASLQIPSNATNGTASVSLTGTAETPPAVSPNDATVTFGQLTTGQTQTEELTITNSGEEPLQIYGNYVTGSSFSDEADACYYAYLPSGDSCHIWLTFAPTTDGPQQGELIIDSNGLTWGTVIPLSGTGEYPPTLSAIPSQAAFGQVTTGTTQTETVTVTNSGDLPLNVGQPSLSGANADQFSLVSGDNSCTSALSAQESCTMEVAFSPTTDGAKSATLTLPSNDPNSPATVGLSGTAQTPPTTVLSVSAQDFGRLTTGSSKDELFTITNTGDETLTVGQASVTGVNSDQFAIAAGEDSCSGASMATGESCIVVVTFAPSSGGGKTGALSIPSNAPGSPATISLTGTAVTGPSVTTAQDFDAVAVSQGQMVKTITLSNTGGAPLNFGQASVGGPGAGQFAIVSGQDGCSEQSLPGGGTCTVAVAFAPTEVGAQTATLSIPSNDPSSLTTVALTGIGQAASPARQPSPTPKTSPAPQPAPALAQLKLSSGSTPLQIGRASSLTASVRVSAPGSITFTLVKRVGSKERAVGSVSVTARRAGLVHLALGERFAGRALAPGRYELMVQAKGKDGKDSKRVSAPLVVQASQA